MCKIRQLPLLFGTVLLLLIIIGSYGCGANPTDFSNQCESLKIKGVQLYHQQSRKFLSVNNNSVIPDKDEKYTLYTITFKKHGFLIYDPTWKKFICLWIDKDNKERSKLVARMNPKMLNRCVFVEKSTIDHQYTKYEWFDDDRYAFSFNRNGQQRMNKNNNEILKAFTKRYSENCNVAVEMFCHNMRMMSEDRKIRRSRHKISKHFRVLCKKHYIQN